MKTPIQIQDHVREKLKKSIAKEDPSDYYQRTWLKANEAGIAKFIKNKGYEGK